MASLYTIVLGFCSDIANKGRRPQTERDVRRRVPCQIDRFSWPSYFSFLLNHVGWHNKNTVDTNFQIIQNIFFWAVTKQMWIAKKHSAKKYALFFAIFFKIINHLIFWQRLLEFTESYSERRGNIGQNWHTPIECRDFLLHQFLYDRDKKHLQIARHNLRAVRVQFKKLSTMWSLRRYASKTKDIWRCACFLFFLSSLLSVARWTCLSHTD